MSVLVWTARGTAKWLDGLDERLEVLEIPADPLADPRLDEVKVLIPPLMRNLQDEAYDLRALMAATGSLEFVQAQTAGVDGIVHAVPHGVLLSSVRGAYDELMAELLVAGILTSYKSIPHYVRAQDEASWRPEEVRVVQGAKVLYVGYGSIAQCVERYLAPFGVESLKVARTARDGVDALEALPRLLPLADIVVVLTPLTSATRNLVDERFLASMKPGALLVNGARGACVDTDALIAAARERGIRAFLDVTEPEPLPDGHPLWSAPGVFITPHIGSLVADNNERCFRVIRENLTRWVEGKPVLNRVEHGY
ncbi:dihydrofolate reductase [Actinospica durhamensis]|uniref:Dihydrofolate reductase n=1 Tax=Actinospica durhamensis TaxID=1508375 RepID=A0A941EKQ3_9ACTN|nr:NAD(P)-dependent oxidoreductase [Actinospica durhamensis]MBR7832660.1 dihydrofolate reductase [Actinospica durhamensis]